MDIRTCNIARFDKEYVHQDASMAKFIPEKVKTRYTFGNDRTKFNIEKSRQQVSSGKEKPSPSKQKNQASKKNGRSSQVVCGWKMPEYEDDDGINAWVNKISDRSRSKKVEKSNSDDDEFYRSQRGYFPKQCPSIENYFLFERESLPQRYVKNTQITKFESQSTPRKLNSIQGSDRGLCDDNKRKPSGNVAAHDEPCTTSTGVQTSVISQDTSQNALKQPKTYNERDKRKERIGHIQSARAACVSDQKQTNITAMTNIDDYSGRVADEGYASKSSSATKDADVYEIDDQSEEDGGEEENEEPMQTTRSGGGTNRSIIKLQYTQANTSRTGSMYGDDVKSNDASSMSDNSRDNFHNSNSARNKTYDTSGDLKPITLVLKKITVINDKNVLGDDIVYHKETPKEITTSQRTTIADRGKENINAEDNSVFAIHSKVSSKQFVLPPSLQKYNSKEYTESLSKTTDGKRSVRSPKSFLKSPSGLKTGGVSCQLKDLLPAVETNLRYSFQARNNGSSADMPPAVAYKDFSDSTLNIDGMKLLQNGIELLDDSMDRHICPPFLKPKNVVPPTQQNQDFSKKLIPSPVYPPLYPSSKNASAMSSPLGRMTDRIDERRVQSEKFDPAGRTRLQHSKTDLTRPP